MTTASKPGQSAAPRRRGWLILIALVVIGAACAFAWQQWHASEERQQALELARKGRFTDAEPLLRRLHERYPTDVTILMELTYGIITSGELVTEAEPLLSKWCTLEPANPEPLQLRFDLWLLLQRRDKALADGLKLLELAPKNDGVRRHVVGLLLVAQRYDEAERECRRCLERDSGDPALNYLLAEIQQTQGKHREAIAVLEPLLRRRPSFGPALVLRGRLHREANPPENDQAVALFRRALAADDPSARQAARYQLSQVLAQLGQADEANKLLAEMRSHQEAERLAQDSAQQPDNLAMQVKAAAGLLEIGQTEAGLKLVRRVIDRQPAFAAAHRVLADYYQKQGQAELAAHHRRLEGQP